MELKIYPDSVLRKRAFPLKKVTEKELRKFEAMLDLMYASEGIGLAAPQAGWSVRVVGLDVEGHGDGEKIFVNPRIVASEGLQEEEEGCLSLPGIKCSVKRAERVSVAAYSVRGESLEIEAGGLEARAWQHEIDHLNGILFVDKISISDRVSIRHQLKGLEEPEDE